MMVSQQQIPHLSRADMQKMPIYLGRDIRTTNPRRLHRKLEDMITHSGYTIEYSNMGFAKEVIGEIGVIDGFIRAHKVVDKKGKLNLMIFLIGIVIMLLGLWALTQNMAYILIVLIGISGVIASLPRTKSSHNIIWLKEEGEAYVAEESIAKGIEEGVAKRKASTTQITSEISISIAGQPSDPSFLQELRAELNELVKKIETLSEAQLPPSQR